MMSDSKLLLNGLVVESNEYSDESNEVALQTIQTSSWQTDLNHPFITKVKEVITSEKSTTIIMEYVR